MKAKEVIRILERNGWWREKTSSGHRAYSNPDRPELGKVTVPFHGGDLDRKTLASIARQTKLDF